MCTSRIRLRMTGDVHNMTYSKWHHRRRWLAEADICLGQCWLHPDDEIPTSRTSPIVRQSQCIQQRRAELPVAGPLHVQSTEGDGATRSNPQLDAYMADLASRSYSRAVSRNSVMSGTTVYEDALEELPEASGAQCHLETGFGCPL